MVLFDRERIWKAAKKHGQHPNSVHVWAKTNSKKTVGRTISMGGFRRSIILKEISDGMDWLDAEEKYGRLAVRTACADLVRQSMPKILLEYLAG